MKTVYEQHADAFNLVSAYVVLNDKRERVATVAIKFPRDGAERLYAYVHWLGVQMQRGMATGYGYDKRSAAVAAAKRIEWPIDLGVCGPEAFAAALDRDDGADWRRKLEDAGFTVIQAV